MKTAPRLLAITSVAIVALIANPARANFVFGEAMNLGPVVNSSARDEYPCLAPDGLSLYFDSSPDSDVSLYDRCDLFVAVRATTKDNWGPPTKLGPNLNTPQGNWSPHISADGLELYFTSSRPGGYGRDDIWVAKRGSLSDEWGAPVNLGSKVNTGNWEWSPCLSQDGLTLYFSSGSSRLDLYTSCRSTKDAPWEQPVSMGPLINSHAWQAMPAISPNGLLLVFCAEYNLWMTTRRTATSEWEPPAQLGPPIGTLSAWRGPSISRDGRTLLLVGHGVYGGLDIWEAPILPICDFNGDGKVDGKDVLVMADCWGENEPLCDIGPTPMGDGVVDVEDLKALAEYIGKEIEDPTFIAHWAFDETQDNTAHDSAGGNDAAVMGTARWQPSGGKVGGALELSGIANFVTTPFAQDPSQGPFSAFAWVQGGAPGQVIISQAGGANWLMARAPDGTLATDLKQAGPTSKALVSSRVVTDGAWHRVGFCWDGSSRILYVDDVEVAKDTQPSLASSTGKITIGAGSTMLPTSFWKGLIDDVRVYNRVVKP